MLNFEQVRLLEEKVAKAIDYVERLNKERGSMLRREAELKARLEVYQKQEADLKARFESYQSRIAELESLAARFKEEQGKIEEGVLAALDRLNRFEKDIEKSIREKPIDDAPKSKAAPAGKPAEQAPVADEPGLGTEIPEDVEDPLADDADGDTGNGGGDAGNTGGEAGSVGEADEDSREKGGELDIF